MVKKIYLVRHGKIDIGDEKRYIGITDISLDETGKRQAIDMRRKLSDIVLDRAYTSPLKRCMETISIILKGRNIEIKEMDELKEINMGDWEYRTFDYIKEHFPEEFKKRGMALDSYTTPKGESFRNLQNRVMSIFNKIIEGKDENVLIVAHAGVNRVILSKLMDLPLKKLMDIKQPYGCINILSFNKDSGKWIWEKE